MFSVQFALYYTNTLSKKESYFLFFFHPWWDGFFILHMAFWEKALKLISLSVTISETQLQGLKAFSCLLLIVNITFNVSVIFFNKHSPNVLTLWMTYLRHLRFSYSSPMEELQSLLMKVRLCTKMFYSRYRVSGLFLGCLLIQLF